MITANRLIEKIADIDNLRLAFWKASKGKTSKRSVREYRENLQQNLLLLQHQITSGDVAVGNYHFFTIFDPKERIICSSDFSERVLHHAIMNICAEYFERKQISHSYACRINKGTYAALDKAKEYSKKYTWCIKLDFRKYFESIKHEDLILSLQKVFKDKKLLAIFEKIIRSYHYETGQGIPIGNLSSQYFANHFLSSADHDALEKLGAKAYIRYIDDVFMWDNDKKRLLEIEKKYRDYCEKDLKLELKPLIINKIKYGIVMLGYKLYRQKVKLAKRSKMRFEKKYDEYLSNYIGGIWTQKQYQNHLEPLFAFIDHAETNNLKKKVLSLSGQ